MEERNAYQRHERRELTFIEHMEGIEQCRNCFMKSFPNAINLIVIFISLYTRELKYRKINV